MRRELLVFVEGRKTEEQYLVQWYRRHRETVLVSIDDFRGGPLQLVQHAAERKGIDARDARKKKGKEYDEYWCVFDVDEHPNMAQALDLARRHDIQVARSNPCIELWFVIHFEDRTAWIDRASAQARSQELLSCSKSLTDAAFGMLYDRSADARRRAEELDRKHEGDGSPRGANPSSGVWRLIASIADR